MDAESLTHLLRGGHYNVSERIARGIWPHPPLDFEDLVEHLEGIISTQAWFPAEHIPHRLGQQVSEFGVIERGKSGQYMYHVQRAHPWDPCSLAEAAAIPFDDAKEAARHYLKWTLHLPGDLDSWQVV